MGSSLARSCRSGSSSDGACSVWGSWHRLLIRDSAGFPAFQFGTNFWEPQQQNAVEGTIAIQPQYAELLKLQTNVDELAT